MARLTFDISMSLDGFVAGPNQTLEQPARRRAAKGSTSGSTALASWREPHGLEGGTTRPDSDVVEESTQRRGRRHGQADVQRRRRARGRTTRTRTAGGATTLPSACRCSSSPTTLASR